MEGIADVHNQRTLLRNEVELSIDVSVDAFASLTANGDDGCISSFHLLVDGDGGDGNLGIFLLAHHLHLEPLGRVTLGLEFYFGIFDIFAIDIGERKCRADAGILQTFEHVDDIGRMNTTRTCTTAEEVVGVLAKQGNGLNGAVLPRQYSVVLEQHNTLGSTLTSDGSMGDEVGIVRGRVLAEAGCLHDIFQHAAHVAVDISNIEFTALHPFNNLLYLGRLSWLHKVVASLYLGNGGQSFANANPVSHHDTLIAPVVAQNLGQQVVVAHRELAINLVVGCHNGPRVALADGNLEAAQIKLTGCTLADTLVDTGTVSLL